MKIRIVKVPDNIKNASKWKHDLGGYLFTHGGDWTNGLSTVDAGGTHEQNPYQGVPMGIAPDNQPNLVEQGEVIFNDYVFSNRLHPSEKELEKANLPKRYKGHTFALIAEDMGKESSERPNDPISKRGLEDSMMKLAMIQEAQRARKGKKGTQQMMAFGGRKYDGVESIPETTVTADYNKMPEFDVRATTDSLDPIAQAFKDRNSRLADMEFLPKVDNPLIKTPGLAKGTTEAVAENSRQDAIRRGITDDDSFSTLPTYLRYAPAVGSALGAIHSAFQEPDYSNSDILLNQANNLSRKGVKARTLNNYLTYKPLDRNYYLNQLKGQAGATRRAIMNSGSNPGQAMAGLLAADYNAQNAVGNALMQMDQYNNAQRQQIAQFNRGTDQYNSQALMQADTQNAQLAANRDRLRSQLLTTAAGMREASDTALEASRSANFTNMFDNLGGIGRENFIFNQINTNPAWASAYKDLSGTIGHKISKGGMLTKKNRRRR